MNIRQNGLGTCTKHGVKIFSGPSGATCLSCEAEKDSGHGDTVIVTEPQGEKGPVHIQTILNDLPVDRGEPVHRRDAIHISVTVDDLMSSNILIMLLQKIHSGIDEMAPPTSIRDMKKIVAIQDGVEQLIQQLTKGDTDGKQ